MKPELKMAAAALGAAMSITAGAVSAADNPFGVTQFQAGYMVAGEEGHCGGDKDAEGKCGGEKDAEGHCGGAKDAEGKCGGDKGAEGKCGS